VGLKIDKYVVGRHSVLWELGEINCSLDETDQGVTTYRLNGALTWRNALASNEWM
jgi:hypothetical protein